MGELRLTGLASGMDTDFIIEQLMKAHRLKATKIENKITTTEWKQEKWKELNSKIYSFYTNQLSKLRFQSSFLTKKAVSSNQNKVEVTAGTNAADGTHIIKVKQLASAQFMTGDKINKANISLSTKLTDLDIDASSNPTITIKIGEQSTEFTIDENKTVGDFVNALKKAGLNANFDTVHNRFFISSKESGKENEFTITSSSPEILEKLGLGSKASVVDAQDAEIVYNGVTLTSSSNNFTVNGLTLILKETTAVDEQISITVSNNTEAVYNMVKDFVKAYNELITEFNKAYYADSARGFDPLTDEEKEKMTDEQIAKWESKIKDALLRRDNTLGSLITTFRDILSDSVSINGKKYSLSSFGIVTGDYSEKGLLHISGDSDFASVALSENKLMDALNNNPDEVMQVLSKLASDLYNTLTEKMKSTSLSSALTVYNDKELAKQITDYKSELKRMEDRLSELEEKYYRQFSAMESALAKMNSQSSFLMSMLGMNNN